MKDSATQKFAIRFGLGAIKAVGINAMEEVTKERNKNGKFKNIYDFAKRLDPKFINKKSIEALAKSGAFDDIHSNRHQIAESFDILSAYSNQENEVKSSNQMSFFGNVIDRENNPPLKNCKEWNKTERLQQEFEAFGFFLNDHPLDETKEELQKRGIVSSEKIISDKLEDGDLIKIAGIVISSKHRSSTRGRFAYLYLSDSYGVFEAMIFDEKLITESRGLIADGSRVIIECSVRKDDGGIRILVKKIINLEIFINEVKPREKPFEDISKTKNNYKKFNNKAYQKSPNKNFDSSQNNNYQQKIEEIKNKKFLKQVEITIKERDSIFSLKAFLQQKKAPQTFSEGSRVVIMVLGNKTTKIALSSFYLIDNDDILKIKNISKIIAVEGY